MWEVAVLFHLRDAFRSGDIWLAYSKRYADLKQALIPVAATKSVPRLAVPFDPEIWIRDRKARMTDGLKRLAKTARNGAIPSGTIEDGILHVDRLKQDVPPEADELVLDLYRRLPERTLFIIDWLLDTDMQRRAQIGLNKGEAHHALKNALRIGRQGEIRDRTAEGQHYHMAGLNILAAIVIYWNTKQLGIAVAARLKEGKDCPDALLSHISPLGWAHILLTGEYRWRKQRP